MFAFSPVIRLHIHDDDDDILSYKQYHNYTCGFNRIAVER